MTRRKALWAAAGVALCGVAPILATAEEEPKLRTIFRIDPTGKTRVRMRELKAGDRFTIDLEEGWPLGGVWIAATDSYPPRGEDKTWGIDATYIPECLQ